MKKHLIAAAVAAAVAVPAMAQVTVSGTLDVNPYTVTEVTFGNSSATAADAIKFNSSTNSQQIFGGWSTSELVFSAAEDLGGGLSANAVYSFAIDVNGGLGVGRAAYVQLASGSMGTVRFGRDNTLVNGFAGFTGVGTTLTSGSVDSNGADLVAGTFGGAHTTPAATAAGFTAVAAAGGSMAGRTPGVIRYTTPSFSGLTVAVEMINQVSDLDGTTNPNSVKVDQKSLHLAYSAGKITAAANFTNRQTDTELITTAQADADLYWVGASYNLGMARVFGAYGSRKDVSTDNKNTTALATSYDANVYSFGVQVPMGATTISVSAYSGKNDGAIETADDRDASGYQLGARYAFSKRTHAYVVTGMDKNTDKTPANAAAQADSFKITQTAIGVSHSF